MPRAAWQKTHRKNGDPTGLRFLRRDIPPISVTEKAERDEIAVLVEALANRPIPWAGSHG